jgi:hypothetical protein
LDGQSFEWFKMEWPPTGSALQTCFVYQYGKGKLAVSSRTRWRTSASVSRVLVRNFFALSAISNRAGGLEGANRRVLNPGDRLHN